MKGPDKIVSRDLSVETREMLDLAEDQHHHNAEDKAGHHAAGDVAHDAAKAQQACGQGEHSHQQRHGEQFLRGECIAHFIRDASDRDSQLVGGNHFHENRTNREGGKNWSKDSRIKSVDRTYSGHDGITDSLGKIDQRISRAGDDIGAGGAHVSILVPVEDQRRFSLSANSVCFTPRAAARR